MNTLSSIYKKITENTKKSFIVFPKKTLKYSELNIIINKISGYFKQVGIKTNHKIIIFSQDDEVVSAFSIASLLNGVTVTIIPHDTPNLRLNSIIEHVRPNLIVIDIENKALLSTHYKHAVFYITKPVSSGLLAKFKRPQKTGWLQKIDEISTMTAPVLQAKPNDIAFIFFTSGSMSAPKGVQLSYQNLFTHLDTLGKHFAYTEQSHILNNMMLAHADGMIQGPILSLYFSATLYRPCNMDLKNIEFYLNTIHREHITHLITVPTILSFIDKFSLHHDYFNTSHFKVLASVAGSLNPELWSRLEKRFKVRISNIYGLTETVAGGIFCGPNDGSYQLGSIGKPIDMEAKIINELNEEILDATEGELLLKGDNVFVGYYQNSEETKAVMHDGWLKTGDSAYRNSEGFIYLKGRIKELIVSGGFNIHPAEINEVLSEHKDILDVGTTSLTHPELQEIAVSAVVLKTGKNINEKNLIEYCRTYLEPKKVPKKIIFIEKIPRGISGKIITPKLKKLFIIDDAVNNSAALSIDDFFVLVANELNVEKELLSLNDKAGELIGWDSLAHLNLMLAVEKSTNIHLSAQEIMTISSLGNLWDVIQNKLNSLSK